ncbi:hypothetical protein C2845_PM03G33280 [Panicum miliaceum]|uniref:CST complex subunit CTC1 n=1 Tax=Panicum miliaceum TaxID=4540 RepID=A0A3L6T4G5_PANMI|nr:hypothetical protein C2845_PM03G33280 [Panicum miliaceum]
MEPPPPEPTPTPRRFTVADLLRLRRPTTGASSLYFPSANAPTSLPRKRPKLAATAGRIPSSTSTSGTAPFAPISHPALLSGTLSLPSAAAPAGCRNSCFTFSDPRPLRFPLPRRLRLLLPPRLRPRGAGPRDTRPRVELPPLRPPPRRRGRARGGPLAPRGGGARAGPGT